MTARMFKLDTDTSIPNWAVLKLADGHHAGIEEMRAYEDDSNGMYWYCSYRIGRACVEGDIGEFRAIAEAIEAGESIEFRRCAATRLEDGSYEIYSPRNESEPYPVVTAGEAVNIVSAIREALGPTG